MKCMGDFIYREGISKFLIWLMISLRIWLLHYLEIILQKLLFSTPQPSSCSQSLSEALWLLWLVEKRMPSASTGPQCQGGLQSLVFDSISVLFLSKEVGGNSGEKNVVTFFFFFFEVLLHKYQHFDAYTLWNNYVLFLHWCLISG